MRVLHVIPSVGPLRGGPSAAIRSMAHALRDAGLEVDVATTDDNDQQRLQVPIGRPVDEHGVRYWYFRRTTHPYTSSVGLARWLRSNVPLYNVVHTHALFSFSTAAAAAVAHRRRVPYIVRPLGSLAVYGMQQNALLKRMSWLLFERRILRHAAAVHFTSEAERAEAERLGSWRSVVVPLAIEEAPGASKSPHDGLVFLFLSRIHPKKRVHLLLRAFAEVLRAAPSARLVVAGSGAADHTAQLHQLASELGIAERVTWPGHVSGLEKQRLLAGADIFVLPSINENFGIAAVEALAAGLPLVLTRGVAIHQEVAQHGAGLIVNGEPAALAAGMLALRDTAARAAMSARARALAQDTFSMSTMQQGLLRMYQQVLAP